MLTDAQRDKIVNDILTNIQGIDDVIINSIVGQVTHHNITIVSYSLFETNPSVLDTVPKLIADITDDKFDYCITIFPKDRHIWTVTSVGEFFTEYTCKRCGKTRVIQDDEYVIPLLPLTGCTGAPDREIQHVRV